MQVFPAGGGANPGRAAAADDGVHPTTGEGATREVHAGSTAYQEGDREKGTHNGH